MEHEYVQEPTKGPSLKADKSKSYLPNLYGLDRCELKIFAIYTQRHAILVLVTHSRTKTDIRAAVNHNKCFSLVNTCHMFRPF